MIMCIRLFDTQILLIFRLPLAVNCVNYTSFIMLKHIYLFIFLNLNFTLSKICYHFVIDLFLILDLQFNDVIFVFVNYSHPIGLFPLNTVVSEYLCYMVEVELDKKMYLSVVFFHLEVMKRHSYKDYFEFRWVSYIR
jgi:hypothetical protein